MRNIRVMDENLANKIAAGEIIERPLSVVKELVENAIDANAKQIQIELTESGISKIQVSDDGYGMDKENLALSIKRHATSKVYDDHELFKIATLGFRGEALASIYAVSEVSIYSCTDSGPAHLLKKQADESFELSETSANKGTTVIVENLFYNTPVRFKHLSNAHYELALIVNYINKLALTMPNISFKLLNNSQEIISTYGNNDVLHTISQVYSSKIAMKMKFIDVSSDNFSIKAYISHPDDTRSKRNFITLSVNGRIIKNYQIENAIIESYGHYLHTNQFPIVIMDIKIDYSLIDVNIHPTKQQVKISLIDELLNLIKNSINEQLKSLMYIAHNDNNQYSGSDFPKTVSNEDTSPVNSIITEFSMPLKEEFVGLDIQTGKKEQFNLFDTISEKSEFETPRLPAMEYIGTLHNTYLLFQNENGLYLLDQHAAQERVNYEIIYRKFEQREFSYQQLLIPLVISFTSDEYLQIHDKFDLVASLGIKLEEFGYNTLKVGEVDNFYMQAGNLEQDIRLLLKKLMKLKELDFAKIYEDSAIMMACKSSIKANQYLNRAEVDQLINDLNQCDKPYTCPHGRPVIVNVSTKDIEKMFKRVFG